jgi:hypothetical protein
MKPTERKQFYQDNRQKLSIPEMAEALGIGLPALKNYEKRYGPCVGASQTTESFTDFLLKAKTEKELATNFPDWEDRLKEKYAGLTLFTQRNLYNEPVYILLPVRNDKLRLKPKRWSFHIGKNDDGTEQPYLLVQLPAFKGKVTIAPLFDVHYGHHAHRSEKFLAYLRWIAETPNVYVVLGGDFMETALDDGRGMTYDQDVNTETQFDHAVNLLGPIAHKILGAVPGNHEERVYKKTGIDIMRLLSERLEIPYFAGPFIMSVMGNGYKWTYHVQHGKGNSQTKGGKMNMAGRPRMFTNLVHFFLVGHVHDLTVDPETTIVEDVINCRLRYMTQWKVIAPSFLGWERTYAWRAGYAPPAMGGVSTELYDNGEYRAFLT